MNDSNKGRKFPPEILNSVEIAALLSTFGQSWTGQRNKTLVIVYLRSGLRCREALALRWCDVFVEGSLYGLSVLRGKGGKRRLVGLDAEAKDHIEMWRAREAGLLGLNDSARQALDEGSLIFRTARGDGIQTSYVRHMIKRHADKAGIKKRVHVHGLRHTAAFQMASEGVPLLLIQKQLGHSNIQTTYRYLNHLSPFDVLQAMGKRQWNASTD